MFYLVPAGQPIDTFVRTTESLVAARFFVNFMKKTRDEEYDIIELQRYSYEDIAQIDTSIDETLYL